MSAIFFPSFLIISAFHSEISVLQKLFFCNKKSCPYENLIGQDKPAVPPIFIPSRNALSHVRSYMFHNNGWIPSPLHLLLGISVCPHKSIHSHSYITVPPSRDSLGIRHQSYYSCSSVFIIVSIIILKKNIVNDKIPFISKRRPAPRQADTPSTRLSVQGTPGIRRLPHRYRFYCHINHIVFGFSPGKDSA